MLQVFNEVNNHSPQCNADGKLTKAFLKHFFKIQEFGDFFYNVAEYSPFFKISLRLEQNYFNGEK